MSRPSEPRNASRKSLQNPEDPPDSDTNAASVNWWQQPPGQIATFIARLVSEKNDAELHASQAGQREEALKARCGFLEVEIEAQRVQFTEQLERMRSESSASGGASGESASGEGRRRAEIAAQERLMREQVERRVHSIRLEWKREREKARQQIDALETELATYRLTSGDF